MLKALRGYCTVEITGAAPELCLNRLTRRDIPFWDLKRIDAFTVRCRIYPAHWQAAEKEITGCLCAGKRIDQGGLPFILRDLRRRPVLVASTVLAVLTAMLAQYWVWSVRIEENELVTEREIRAALTEEGIGFGTWGPGIDTQYVKNRMLNRVPALQWCAVNPEGCIAHVLVSERTPEPVEAPDYPVANVIARRDGVILRISVDNGFPAVEAGDAVLEGQLLVSGFAEWTTHIQATAAMAEVEALTKRTYSLQMPVQYGQKEYTGRTETCKTLIFRRIRIKISGNSSIFGTRCDKILENKPMTLPGGFKFPLAVEIATLHEYRLTECTLGVSEAEADLRAAAEALAAADMLAGVVESEELTTEQTAEGYRGRAVLYCREIISQQVPAELFGEEEQYGENHQRGEN